MKGLRISVLLLLATVFSGVTTVFSETTIDTIQVTLHKRLLEEDISDVIQNTGEELDFEGKPLAEVEFQVFDVTDEYHNLVTTTSQEEVLENLQTKFAQPTKEKERTTTTTNAQGEAQFTLPTKNGEKDAVYVFVESKLPDDFVITKRATPLILMLPVYKMNKNGSFSEQLVDEVHLYPKNIGYQPIPEEPEKPEKPEKPKEPQPEKPKRPLLPQTGEAKSMIGLVGIVLIGTAISFWRKRVTQK